MATWQLLSDEAAARIWDEALLKFDDYSPYQSYAFGEYRRALGWEPCRWAAFNEQDEIVALMMGSLRRYPLKLGLVYCEGGPVGDLSACGQDLQTAIKQTTGLRWVYCRFRCDRARNIEDVLRLTAQGWSRAWFTLTPGYTMQLDLSRDEKSTLKACEHNWRRNLRRANENNLTVRRWLDPDVDEVVSVYDSMQSLKGLGEQHSREEISQIWKHLGNQIALYRCDDENGVLVSLIGWVVFGRRAWGIFSANTEQGRKLHSSYLMYWTIIQHCRSLQIECSDLAGIDPIENHGVYRFKRGTGASPLEYLGEWDWASAPWLRWCGNWAISRREQLKRVEASLKGSSTLPGKTLSERVHPAPLPQTRMAERLQTPV
ncbi:MAG: peptidoglycan bridge formation glycyltransferase FemA/FemB family protein [Pyrinomonadaceae bacterium]